MLLRRFAQHGAIQAASDRCGQSQRQHSPSASFQPFYWTYIFVAQTSLLQRLCQPGCHSVSTPYRRAGQHPIQSRVNLHRLSNFDLHLDRGFEFDAHRYRLAAVSEENTGSGAAARHDRQRAAIHMRKQHARRFQGDVTYAPKGAGEGSHRVGKDLCDGDRDWGRRGRTPSS